tara:strand:+ start:1023 stop:1484 length:462 start_codon:yes stop_codon:yes gene_type:complete
MIIVNTIGFQMNICNNNDLQLKKIPNSFDRRIYAKYLINKRKSQKILKTNTLVKYFNETIEDIDNTCHELQDNIHEYNNKNANIKKIIIGNNIHIDVKNVKNIMISTNNDNITIELDKSYKKTINNDIVLLSKNIKELDTLLNLLDIFLNILK